MPPKPRLLRILCKIPKNTKFIKLYNLSVLSLREVAVLFRNRADQIDIGDKETRKNNKQYTTTPLLSMRGCHIIRIIEHARMCTRGFAYLNPFSSVYI
jgi:hypothetical protein